MERLGLLNGFHMVAAITEDTINSELERLWKTKEVLRSFTFEKGKQRLQVKLDPPTVQFGAYANDPYDVLFRLHLREGTFTYWKLDAGDPELVNATVDNWVLAFKVNTDLKGIAHDAVRRHAYVPDQVKAQLDRFRENMFTIEHLFMNFQSLDLGRIDLPHTVTGNLPETARTRLGEFLIAYLQDRWKAGNPFVLGLSVINKPAQMVAEAPTYQPTGTTYSLSANPDKPGLSTLNFCLMTNGAPMPGDRHAGEFKVRWVTDDSGDGTFVVEHSLFFENRLLPALRELLKAAKPFQPTPEGWTLTDEFSQEHEQFPVYQKATRSRICRVKVTDRRVEIAGSLKLHYNMETRPNAPGVWVKMDASLPFTITLTPRIDEEGRMVFQQENDIQQPEIKVEKGDLFKLAEALVSVFDRKLAETEELLRRATAEMLGWEFANIAAITADMRARFVMPAGKVFFFKDARFNREGDLLATITYKD